MLLLQILGQCLNTVVQTLVAGAFVEFMPKTIFWLGAVVTGEHRTHCKSVVQVCRACSSGSSNMQ
jgi:hypothetical protein